MNRKGKIGIISLVIVGLMMAPGGVLADESKTVSSKNSTKKLQPEKKNQKAEKKPADASKKAGEKKRFVDRDGDGIQDGMEHRFRRHKRHRSKGKWRTEGRHLKRAGKGKKHNGNKGN